MKTETYKSDILAHMESTEGWQWLKDEYLQPEADRITDEILNSSDKDDINRGKLKMIREMFAFIEQIHLNKKEA